MSTSKKAKRRLIRLVLALGLASALFGRVALAEEGAFRGGTAAARQGRCEEAASQYARVPDGTLEHGLASLNLAMCYRTIAEYQKAFDAIHEAQRRGPDDVATAAMQLHDLWCHELVDAARILIDQGRLGEARTLLTVVRNHDQARKTDAEAEFERLAEEEREDWWEGQVRLGGGYDTNLARAELEQEQSGGAFVDLDATIDYVQVFEKAWTLRIGYDLSGQLVPEDFEDAPAGYVEEYSYQRHGLWFDGSFADSDFVWGMQLDPYLSLVGMNPPSLFMAGAMARPYITHTWTIGLQAGGGVHVGWDAALDGDYDYLEGMTVGVDVWVWYPFVSWFDMSLIGWFDWSMLGTLDLAAPDGDFRVPFSSMGMGGRIEATFHLGEAWEFLVAGGLNNERYLDPVTASDGSETYRIDLTQRYAAKVIWRFADPFWIEARYVLEVNDSTLGQDDYDDKNYLRHEGAGAVGVWF